MVFEQMSRDQTEVVWRLLFEWIAASPEYTIEEPLSVGVRDARTWWDAQARRAQGSTALMFDDRPDAEPTHAWWAGDQEQVSAFLHGYDSLWLPVELLTAAHRDHLAAAIAAASRHTAMALHFNKGLSWTGLTSSPTSSRASVHSGPSAPAFPM
jgi:hypothetical protein